MRFLIKNRNAYAFVHHRQLAGVFHTAHPHANHQMVSANVMSVIGKPTRMYVPNDSVTPCAAARSATIRLAIDASSVLLPANVELAASMTHAVCG